jgi:hypothetical protein
VSLVFADCRPTRRASDWWESARFCIKFKFKIVLQNLPNIVCSGRVATLRLRAFFRSKIFARFAGWFSWQPAANTCRWLAVRNNKIEKGEVKNGLDVYFPERSYSYIWSLHLGHWGFGTCQKASIRFFGKSINVGYAFGFSAKSYKLIRSTF